MKHQIFTLFAMALLMAAGQDLVLAGAFPDSVSNGILVEVEDGYPWPDAPQANEYVEVKFNISPDTNLYGEAVNHHYTNQRYDLSTRVQDATDTNEGEIVALQIENQSVNKPANLATVQQVFIASATYDVTWLNASTVRVEQVDNLAWPNCPTNLVASITVTARFPDTNNKWVICRAGLEAETVAAPEAAEWDVSTANDPIQHLFLADAQQTQPEAEGVHGAAAAAVARLPEWSVWPGGNADTDLNPVEKLTAKYVFGQATAVDWTVNKGAKIIEASPALDQNDTQTAALAKTWIKVRYDTTSPTAAQNDAVTITASKNNVNKTVQRTVFKVSWVIRTTGDLTDKAEADGNKLDFAAAGIYPETSEHSTRCGFVWKGEGDAQRQAAKMEAVASFSPTGIKWQDRGVRFVYDAGDGGAIGHFRFAREHRQEVLLRQLGDEENRQWIANWPNDLDEASFDWKIDGRAKTIDAQYPDGNDHPDRAFRIDAPGLVTLKYAQVVLHADFREFMQWYDGEKWQICTPYGKWNLQLNCEATPPATELSRINGETNAHAAGYIPDGTKLKNSAPNADITVQGNPKPGNTITLYAVWADDADKDFIKRTINGQVTYIGHEWGRDAIKFEQTAGPDVNINHNTALFKRRMATVTIPQNMAPGTDLKFKVTITESLAKAQRWKPDNITASKEVTITVVP